ncbi:MAG: hypothetical protein QOE35_179 [Actinomycetota bacterium]|jgi:hypothetical protein
MPTLEGPGDELDSGYVAVLGHRILDAACVVSGALETLREAGESMSPVGRAVLEREVTRSIDAIIDTGRSLVRADGSPMDRDAAWASSASASR